MLAVDPSEAIHSDLVIPHLSRYFSIDHLRPTGGGLAYEILRDNPPFYAPSSRQAELLEQVLVADEEYLGGNMARSLFFFALARPAKEVIAPELLGKWTREEDRRECEAAARGGRYHDVTLLEELYERIYSATITEEQAATISELRQRVARLERPKEGLRVFMRSVPGALPAVRAIRRATRRNILP
jgi:hypothetical protein